MAYFVSHTQKHNAKSLKGIGIHNERTAQNSKNQDIKKQNSELNYDLHNGDLKISYEAAVERILKTNFKGNKKIRENAVKMTSTVISASPEFFENKSAEEIKKYFEINYEYLKERVGEGNVVSAKVHMDEKTPHMHFCSVPLTKDGRLSAKELYDRTALRELQSEPLELIKAHFQDVERGKINHTGKNKHIDSEIFKKQELQKQIEDLTQKNNSLQALRDLRNKAKKKEKKKIFSSQKEYVVDEATLDDLVSLASRTNDILELNQSLSKKLKEEYDKNSGLENDNRKLKTENQKQNLQISQFKTRLEKNNLNSEYIEHKIIFFICLVL